MLLSSICLSSKAFAQPHAKTCCTLKVTKANNINFEQLHFYTSSPRIFSQKKKKDNTGGRGKILPAILIRRTYVCVGIYNSSGTGTATF